MTKEGYEYNITRITYFTNQELIEPLYQNPTPMNLMNHYCRYLDIFSAPISALSFLYLIRDDYIELVNQYSPNIEANLRNTQNPFGNPFLTLYHFGYKFTIRMIHDYPSLIHK